MIDANMWDDDVFVKLSVRTKLLWCYLKTCESFVPGLVRGATVSIAESLRFSREQTLGAFRQLIDCGRLEYDDTKRLIRVVDLIQPPSNQRVVKGWFRRWERLPDSPLKYHHLELLYDAVCHGRDKPWARDIWVETFGQIVNPYETVTSQGELFASTPKPNGIDTVSEPYRNPKFRILKNDSQLDGIGNRIDTVSIRTSPEPDPTPEPKPDPEKRNRIETVSPGPCSRQLCERFPLESRLWDVQEGLRSELHLPRLSATAEDLERVRQGLADAGFGEPEALLALRAHHAECAKDITKSCFFNGRTNWQPQNLRVAATRAPQAPRTSSTDSRQRDLGEEARLAARSPRIDQEALNEFAAAWGAGSGHGPNEGVS